jgi:hypothetical protein
MSIPRITKWSQVLVHMCLSWCLLLRLFFGCADDGLHCGKSSSLSVTRNLADMKGQWKAAVAQPFHRVRSGILYCDWHLDSYLGSEQCKLQTLILRQLLIVVFRIMNYVIYSWGDARGYIYNTKTKLIVNHLDSSYRQPRSISDIAALFLSCASLISQHLTLKV